MHTRASVPIRSLRGISAVGLFAVFTAAAFSPAQEASPLPSSVSERQISIGLQPAAESAGSFIASGPTLWVLLVDVGHYDHPRIFPLPATQSDMDALEAVYRAMQPDHRLFSRCIVWRLSATKPNLAFEDRPKRQNIRDLFEDKDRGIIAKTAPGDTVLFFFGGHGITYKGEQWILPMDAIPGRYENTAIRLEQLFTWLRQIEENGGRTVLFLDACRNEVLQPETGRPGAAQSGQMTREFFDKLVNNARGRAIFSAVREGQYAKNDTFPDPLQPQARREYGVFSHFIIQGLLGKADSNADGVVTLSELNEYASALVENHVTRRRLPPQQPTLTMVDVSGVLAVGFVPQGKIEPIEPPAAPSVQAGTPAPPPAPEMPSIPAEAVEAASAAPASDIALVAPRSGVPGIELTEKPTKSLSRLEAQGGVTFAWRATGEAYGARYRYRLNDQPPVENYPRASVTLSNLEAGRRHTFQVQAQTRQGASEPAVYAFEVRANEPPTVAFAEAPAQGAQVAASAVRVRLTGSDPDGKVTRYTLAVNDPDDPQRVFENATGEFELTDKVLEDGLHRLIAQTMDDSGALSPPATRDFTFRYTAVTPTPPPTPKPDYAKKSDDGRFLVSSEGVIHDTKTKLEWIVGPDQDTNYDNAVKWVESCRVAGGGWRMPTRKELLELYQKGKGDRNIDPVFKHTGWWVWGEPRDSSSAWGVFFTYSYIISGIEYWHDHDPSNNGRVFGVRSRR